MRFFSQAPRFRTVMPPDPRSEKGPKRPSGAPPEDPLAKLREPKGASQLGAAGRYMGLGLQFVVSILLFLYAGQWLDRRLGTRSLFLILGVFVGASAAFYSMYRTLMAEQRRDQDRKAGGKK